MGRCVAVGVGRCVAVGVGRCVAVGVGRCVAVGVGMHMVFAICSSWSPDSPSSPTWMCRHG